MTVKIAYVFLALLVSVPTLIFAFFNGTNVPVSYFGTVMQVPLALIVVKCFVLGGVFVLAITRIRRREQKSEQKQLEWKAQDAKLAAEIKDDNVKLLEAKIATLEAALERSLKKKG
jgi:uncharacterized integral membrane protein